MRLILADDAHARASVVGRAREKDLGLRLVERASFFVDPHVARQRFGRRSRGTGAFAERVRDRNVRFLRLATGHEPGEKDKGGRGTRGNAWRHALLSTASRPGEKWCKVRVT